MSLRKKTWMFLFLITLSCLFISCDINQPVDSSLYIKIAGSTERRPVVASEFAFKIDDQNFVNQAGTSKSTPQSRFEQIFASFNPRAGAVFPKTGPFVIEPGDRDIAFEAFKEPDINKANTRVLAPNNLIAGIDPGSGIVTHCRNG